MAEIQLSPELFKDIQLAVNKQEPNADPGVTMQYMAAVMGYMLANQRQIPDQEKLDYMNELCDFSRHVFDDLMRSHAQQQQSVAGEALGYWNPPKS